MMRIAILLSMVTVLSFTVGAQSEQSDSLIQFSGLVLTEEGGELIPLPLTNIYLIKSGRGTYVDKDGFFSLVARQGEVVRFSSIGYSTIDFVIPDTLTDTRYSVYQVMTRDTFNLPEAQVYPWPSREHFKIEFLAMVLPHDFIR